MTALTHTWQPTVERLQRAWRGSPLPAFLAWWGHELRACLPARLAAWLARDASWYRLSLAGDELHVHADGAATPLASIDTTQAEALQQAAWHDVLAATDAQDLRVALCLPPEQVLRRQLTLPAAARADLRRVAGYEMDRQTPFRVNEVCYDVRVRDALPDGRLDAELVLVPRQRLAPMLERLTTLGARVDAVDVSTDAGRLGVNLLDATARPAHRYPRRRLNLILAGIAVVLLAVCLGQWLHNRRQLLADMQTQVDSLHQQARQVATLRRQLVTRMGAAGFLQQHRSEAPVMIAVLADITHRLPDDTWLERFSLDANGNISLQGQSPHATGLLKRLADSAYLSDPGFQGVIQTDPSTGKERFYLTAKLHAPTPAELKASSPRAVPAHATSAHVASAHAASAHATARAVSLPVKEGAHAQAERH